MGREVGQQKNEVIKNFIFLRPKIYKLPRPSR